MNEMINLDGLECLVLIGSHARGDDDLFSDVDLLGVVSTEDHKMVNVKKVNLSIYSESYLRNMMMQGELFALHVVSEGVSLVNESLFKDICADFKYKDSYFKDKALAYLMGEMILAEQSNITNWSLANKRITWCIRTYILSVMAENKAPCFSKESIAFYGASLHPRLSYLDFLNLVNAKQNNGYAKSIFLLLERFLREIEMYKPSPEYANSLYIKNNILKNTLNQVLSGFY